MYNNPYYIPGYYSSPIYGMMPNFRFPRGIGFMGRLGNSFSWIRGINWSNFLNGASKTLGVVNQTIPLVRQVGPIVNNMRSMFKLFSAFRDVTDNSGQKKASENTNTTNSSYDNNPTFFTP